MSRFFIIDGNSLVHRSYHAVPKHFRSASGEPTNAVFGFVSILLGMLEQEKPDYVAVAFDKKGPTFRHAMMGEYKGTRVKTDDDLIVQFPRVREVLNTLNIPIFEKDGLEADDFLGIMAQELESKHPEVQLFIVTSDQDALQLVSEQTQVVSPVKGYSEVKRYDAAAVKEKLGVWPHQVADFKGLRGDSSDNIPGVPGIGPKTAVSLLEQYGSLENLYAHLEDVESPAVREKLRAHEGDARLSKEVASILRFDPDFALHLDTCVMHDFNVDAVRQLFETLAFKAHLKRLEGLNMAWQKKREEERQPSLF
jgi:DNA polymerase-1